MGKVERSTENWQWWEYHTRYEVPAPVHIAHESTCTTNEQTLKWLNLLEKTKSKWRDATMAMTQSQKRNWRQVLLKLFKIKRATSHWRDEPQNWNETRGKVETKEKHDIHVATLNMKQPLWCSGDIVSYADCGLHPMALCKMNSNMNLDQLCFCVYHIPRMMPGFVLVLKVDKQCRRSIHPHSIRILSESAFSVERNATPENLTRIELFIAIRSVDSQCGMCAVCASWNKYNLILPKLSIRKFRCIGSVPLCFVVIYSIFICWLFVVRRILLQPQYTIDQNKTQNSERERKNDESRETWENRIDAV